MPVGTCETCMWWEASTKHCHRFPPTPDANVGSELSFPLINANEWCGEYKKA